MGTAFNTLTDWSDKEFLKILKPLTSSLKPKAEM